MPITEQDLDTENKVKHIAALQQEIAATAEQLKKILIAGFDAYLKTSKDAGKLANLSTETFLDELLLPNSDRTKLSTTDTFGNKTKAVAEYWGFLKSSISALDKCAAKLIMLHNRLYEAISAQKKQLISNINEANKKIETITILIKQANNLLDDSKLRVTDNVLKFNEEVSDKKIIEKKIKELTNLISALEEFTKPSKELDKLASLLNEISKQRDFLSELAKEYKDEFDILKGSEELQYMGSVMKPYKVFEQENRDNFFEIVERAPENIEKMRKAQWVAAVVDTVSQYVGENKYRNAALKEHIDTQVLPAKTAFNQLASEFDSQFCDVIDAVQKELAPILDAADKIKREQHVVFVSKTVESIETVKIGGQLHDITRATEVKEVVTSQLTVCQNLDATLKKLKYEKNLWSGKLQEIVQEENKKAAGEKQKVQAQEQERTQKELKAKQKEQARIQKQLEEKQRIASMKDVELEKIITDFNKELQEDIKLSDETHLDQAKKAIAKAYLYSLSIGQEKWTLQEATGSYQEYKQSKVTLERMANHESEAKSLPVIGMYYRKDFAIEECVFTLNAFKESALKLAPAGGVKQPGSVRQLASASMPVIQSCNSEVNAQISTILLKALENKMQEYLNSRFRGMDGVITMFCRNDDLTSTKKGLVRCIYLDIKELLNKTDSVDKIGELRNIIYKYLLKDLTVRDIAKNNNDQLLQKLGNLAEKTVFNLNCLKYYDAKVPSYAGPVSQSDFEKSGFGRCLLECLKIINKHTVSPGKQVRCLASY